MRGGLEVERRGRECVEEDELGMRKMREGEKYR